MVTVPQWYALRTRSRHEKRVWAQIDHQGIEAFLPLIDRRRRWKDRMVQVQFPLFPGYCFARFAWQDRLRVLTASGVVEVLGVGGHGVPVADAEIEGVRRLVTSTLPVDPYPFLEPGMAVEVRRGPLQGLRGFLVRKAPRARLGIAVVEAMAAGCPVIVSDCVDLAPDVEEAGAGVVVPPTVEATAKALARLLGDASLRRAMGEKGRRLVMERFTWDRVALQLLEVYEDILKGTRTSSAWR